MSDEVPKMQNTIVVNQEVGMLAGIAETIHEIVRGEMVQGK